MSDSAPPAAKNAINFPHSDTVAGYVTGFDAASDTFDVRTSGGQMFKVKIKSNTYARVARNLGDPYADCTRQMRDMLTEGRFVFTYGHFYPEAGGHAFEAEHLTFTGRKSGEYLFEQQDWWVRQIKELGNFYLDAQFPGGNVDYRDYRTTITLNGARSVSFASSCRAVFSTAAR